MKGVSEVSQGFIRYYRLIGFHEYVHIDRAIERERERGIDRERERALVFCMFGRDQLRVASLEFRGLGLMVFESF